MGSRVNYVVVRDGVCRVHALGGGSGLQIDVDFALGPQIALRRLDGDDFAEDGFWFDDVSCEGAVLIDADRRVLLLFNTLLNYPAYRTAMLQGYAATWPGWEIRWAYDGIGDLMAYAGQDPAAAHDDEGPDRTPRNEFDLEYDLVKAIVTVGGRRYGLSGNAAYRRWRMGSGLIDWVTAGPELPEVMEYESLDMVTAGLDLDPGARRAGLWSVEPLWGLRERWAELWPGWTLEFWGDDRGRQEPWEIPADEVHSERGVLAERVRKYWPVRETMLARGVSEEEMGTILRMNFGGTRDRMAAGATTEDVERIAALLRGA